ncbi:MAG: right-handed parallel beta-helix repeat-containing protein, partial [Ignavibacteriaceae bacterium]
MKKFEINQVSILIIIFVVCAVPSVFSQIYVKADAGGMNNGSSWMNAFINLQDALASASAGDTIFVAEGTYYPDKGDGLTQGDRNTSFQLKSGVVLLGGYKGSEEFQGMFYNKYWRNWQNNKTILSGDLLGNDNDNISPDEPTRSDNSLHILFSSAPVDSTAELNGFYIEGGNANSTDGFPGAHGGGIYLSNSTMQIKNCTFSNNTALESGGAIFANSGAIKLKFTAFINNMSNTGAGISIYGADNLDNPNLPAIVNSFFYNNHAVDEGAGIYIANAANVSILNSVFTGNTLSGTNSSGAGIYTDNKSYPAIANCTFYNNTSVSSGGGVTLSAGRIGNSIFKGNSASANSQINIEGAPANSTVFREFMYSIIEGGFQG